MTNAPHADLTCIAEATRFLARRPWTVLGLAALGTALAALASWVQLRLGLPDDLQTTGCLLFAAVVPLELYFIPRFLLEADSAAGGRPGPDQAPWDQLFEARWLKTFGAKVLVGVATGLGLPLLVPGLFMLLAFGWMPLRVLLLGEPLLQAARNSYRMMTLTWRRTLAASTVLILIYLAFGISLSVLIDHWVHLPTLHQRIVHPGVLLGNFISGGLSLWLSACFLALFRRLEADTRPDSAGPQQP